jgi:uracil-DNA glycosylase family 4
MGFFSQSQLQSKKPLPLIPLCGKCGLKDMGCLSPKMPIAGKGKKGIMIIGEAPGEHEDKQNIPFVGKSGQLLREKLRKYGVDPTDDCWLYNALICRPPNNKIPKKVMVEYCRPNVIREIDRLKPTTIILLGGVAVRSLIGYIWKADVGTMTRWVGWRIPSQKFNTWICPTYHPSYISREMTKKYPNPLYERTFEEHIENALQKKAAPWKVIPRYEESVFPITDSEAAVQSIEGFIKRGRPIAFDYETDRLKPDHREARIVCCGISDGRTTVAYPFYGAAVGATKRLLQSPLPKIASNLKFEQRWSIRHFGQGVRNWMTFGDTMLGSHVLDNREDITSIKFQAFVLLGQPPWNEHIESYLESEDGGGNSPNRIDRVDMKDLLIYCGMDSLMEWIVSRIQQQQLRRGK